MNSGSFIFKRGQQQMMVSFQFGVYVDFHLQQLASGNVWFAGYCCFPVQSDHLGLNAWF